MPIELFLFGLLRPNGHGVDMLRLVQRGRPRASFPFGSLDASLGVLNQRDASRLINSKFEGGDAGRRKDLMDHHSIFLKQPYAAIKAKLTCKSKSPLLALGLVARKHSRIIRSVTHVDDIVVRCRSFEGYRHGRRIWHLRFKRVSHRVDGTSNCLGHFRRRLGLRMTGRLAASIANCGHCEHPRSGRSYE